MIKVDSLEEYVSIKTLLNYCSANEKCDKCKLKFLCDLCNGDKKFSSLEVKYEMNNKEEEE